jgi:ATP-binding cassette subfamily B multidrug efflux pump
MAALWNKDPTLILSGQGGCIPAFSELRAGWERADSMAEGYDVRRDAAPGMGRLLLSVLRPWRVQLAFVAFFVMSAAALELVPPLLVRTITDKYLVLGRTEGLLMLAFLYLGATAGVQVITFVYSYMAALVAQGGLYELRVRLFAHLQRLPISYFDRTPQGDIISRCTADIETIDVLFSSGVSTLVGNLFRIGAVVIAMVALSPFLALVSLMVILPLAFVTRFIQVRVRDAERENRLAVGALNTHLQEDLGGTEVIRAFGREDVFLARFRLALRRNLLASNRSTLYSAFYPPVTALLAALATAVLLRVGAGRSLTATGVSIGTITAFVLLFQQFFKPIVALGDQWQTVQSALSGGERVFQTLTIPPDQSQRTQDPKFESNSGIQLREITFGYVPEHPVLTKVSFAVRPGEHVAVVGRTGAGKSSTLSLIGGMYEPWSGIVTVDGIDPRAVPEDQRRLIVGFVPQTVHLFTGTVFENLTLHELTCPQGAVVAAACLAGADEFIRALPEGYDTRLTGSGRGGGAQLSAGQRQLLALARALVWEPRTLLLDEATSAIDGASDAAFRSALRKAVLSRGCAVLTVAHRLSTAREADRVIVMSEGRVVEEGAPDELIRHGGRFAAMLELETAGWDWQKIET